MVAGATTCALADAVGRVPLRVAVGGGAVLVAAARAALGVRRRAAAGTRRRCSTRCAGCRSTARPPRSSSSRVDRTVIALVVGAAVALSGVVLQGLTRNPIAEPGILGLNSGAALAVVVGIRFLGLTTVAGYVVAALVGTVVVAALVQSLTMVAPRQQRHRVAGPRWCGGDGVVAEPDRRRARHRPGCPRQLPLLAGRLRRRSRRRPGARRAALPRRRRGAGPRLRADAQRRRARRRRRAGAGPERAAPPRARRRRSRAARGRRHRARRADRLRRPRRAARRARRRRGRSPPGARGLAARSAARSSCWPTSWVAWSPRRRRCRPASSARCSGRRCSWPWCAGRGGCDDGRHRRRAGRRPPSARAGRRALVVTVLVLLLPRRPGAGARAARRLPRLAARRASASSAASRSPGRRSCCWSRPCRGR